MGCLYMDMGSSGIFGGIFRAMEMGFPLVGGEKGLKCSIIRARVFERNLSTKIITGVGVAHGSSGNFERAIPKSKHPQKI